MPLAAPGPVAAHKIEILRLMLVQTSSCQREVRRLEDYILMHFSGDSGELDHLCTLFRSCRLQSNPLVCSLFTNTAIAELVN